MSARSPKWEEAKRADIKALAERLGARLKKAGSNWTGPCPAGCASQDGFVVTPSKRLFLADHLTSEATPMPKAARSTW